MNATQWLRKLRGRMRNNAQRPPNGRWRWTRLELECLETRLAPSVTLASASLPSWTVNSAGYDQVFNASGGTAPYTYALTTGTLPPGLTLSSGGVLSGTPTVSGTYHFTLTATDSSQAFAYTTLDDPSATPGNTYVQGISGGNIVGYYYDSTGFPLDVHGFLFNGSTYTTLDDPSASPGNTWAYGVSGSNIVGFYYNSSTGYHGFFYNGSTYTTLDDPSATAGTYAQGISGTNIVGYYYDRTGFPSVNIHGFLYNGSTFTTLDDPDATPGNTYAYGISGSNVVGQYYNSSSGYHGYLYNGSTYTTLDDPSASPGDTFAYGISGSNIVGYYGDSTGNHGFLYNGSTYTTLDDPSGAPGMTQAYGVSGRNIIGTYDDSNGGVDGFLATQGASGSQSYTLTINSPVAITTTTLPGWTVNVPGYNQTISAVGGTGTVTFATTAGTLPTGLTLTSAGVLSGTPTATGSYTFTITATDAVNATASQIFTVVISPPVTINTATLPNWTANFAGYDQPISATGETVTFATTAGMLPAGLALTSAGVLSGTPTMPASYTFTITATDALSNTASQGYTVVINPPVTITTVTLPSWTVNVAGYSQHISATGGTGSVVFATTAGTLPTGLTLTSAGMLSGTPTAPGSFLFTVTAVDSLGASVSKNYRMTIRTTWTPLTNQPPQGLGTMLLLTDGTVLAQQQGISNVWYQLTPDSAGSYVNGTWKQMASMSTARLYGGSAVLPNGKLLFMGGEYSGPGGTANNTNTGEIYDPLANTWSAIAPFPLGNFGDNSLEVLANGMVLGGYINGPATYLYNPLTNSWTPTGTKQRLDQSDEESWVKLPDGSILSYDMWASNSSGVFHAQRYVPSTGTWSDASTLDASAPPAALSNSSENEIGPGVLLPDGRVFQIGATGNTALYTPSGSNYAAGTWKAGPVIPGGLVADDTPAAVLPNGHVIFAADTAPYTGPTTLFDFDPVANTITPMTLPGALSTDLRDHAYVDRMLVLPGGDMLLETLASNTDGSVSYRIWDFNPNAMPAASSQPTIASITPGGSRTFTLTGTELNGLDEGAAYGDDAQMASNYPIVQLTDGVSVYTARTLGWSSQVATATTAVNTQFVLPSGIPGGTYLLTVRANGISSAGVNFTVINLPGTLPASTVGNPYSRTLTPSGGSGSYTFTETGALPGGLTLSPAGVLSGTPTAAGSLSITVTATDAAGNTGSQAYSLVVNPAIAITTASLPPLTVNVAGYTQTIVATGGTGALSFAASGMLPPGLALSSAGVLSGTPTAAGSFTFTVTATDTIGAVGSHPFTITINAPVTLPIPPVNWTVNQPGYNQTIAVSGGTGSKTFVETGPLPTGLTLNSAGVLTGTPVATGPFTFTVTATDTVGASGNASFTITINLPGSLGISTLASFNNTNGAFPTAVLIEDSSGTLYGTTASGSGAAQNGTVFEMLKGSGTISTLATFAGGSGGADPVAPLLQDSKGDLFGTSSKGGAFGVGTIFEIPAGSHVVTTLASFKGANPAGPLAADANGDLFGTTSTGGSVGYGSVFEWVQGSTSISMLASFTYSNGANPEGGLVEDSAGNLFGTTESGGAAGAGTVFEVQPGSNLITTLASFTYADGAFPLGGVVLDHAGNLFGTTSGDGSSNQGTVFELMKGSGNISTLGIFTGPNGATPSAAPILDGRGDVFGATAQGGTWGYGTIFEVAAGSSAVTTLADLNGLAAANLTTELALDSSGNLYGISPSGGPAGDGTVFEVIATLPSWTQNQPGYNQTLTVSGGTAPLTFTTSASLPRGLMLSSAGVLVGTPADAGTYSFPVTVTDAAGIVDQHTYTVNINPGVVITTAGLAPGNPGTAYTQTISATGGTGTLTFGTAGTVPPGLSLSGSGVLAGTPTTPGSYTFTVTATDSTGASGAQTYNLSVFGFSPATLGNWTVNTAGYLQTIGLNGGSGPYTYSTTWALPAGLTLSSAGVLSGTPTVASTYTFIVTASSGGAAVISNLYTVVIHSPPLVTPATLPDWAQEKAYNQTINVSGGTAPYTFVEVIGNLPTGLILSPSPASLPTLTDTGILTGTPTAVGQYTFGVVFKDHAGALASQIYTVNIFNPSYSPAPSALNPPSGSVGSSYDKFLPGSGGTLMYMVSGGALPPGMMLSSEGELTGTPTQPGTYHFTVTVTDGMGNTTSVDYTIVILGIGAVAQYQVTAPATVQAGSTFQVTLQEADLYGNPVSSSAAPGVIVSLTGPGVPPNFPMAVALNNSGFGYFLTSLPTTGSYTISVVADSSGVVGSKLGAALPTGQSSFSVTPGPAVKLAFAAQPVNTPTGVVLPPLSVQVEDANGNLAVSDNSDLVSVGIASGPAPGAPGFTAGSTTTVAVHNGVATFNNLTLVKPGSYALSELVPTLYTGANSSPFIVAPLQILPGTLASSPSGFSVQLNAPLLVNSITPVLYGPGFGSSAPVPTVTLTQTKDAGGNAVSVLVEGSLIVNAASSLTFLATNTGLEANNGSPVLPDGTYTVDIRSSGASGLQAASGGGFLDGKATGTAGSGDFISSFTVHAAGTDVLWVPSTADGPGQALSAPGNNQLGGGFPVYLSDSSGVVTSVQVALNYNPTLLTVTGATGPGFSLLATSTPGHAVLQYTGPALATGIQTPIGYLTATVPAGTAASPVPYKAKDLLHLSGALLNGGAISAATSDALHVVAYVGDADGNGTYSSNDAVLITRTALQTDTGFTAYPLVDPVIVGDTDGSGFIPADAALQINEAGVGFPTTNLPSPPIPAGTDFQAIGNNVDPTLSLARGEGSGARGEGVVTVSVNIDDADPAGSTGLIRGQLALRYDPRQFTVSAADVHLGSVLTAGSGWSVTSTINSATGEIAISLASNTPISSPLGGSLVTIDFHPVGRIVNPSNQLGDGRINNPSYINIALVATVNPTGSQVVSTELEDAQGTFTLSFLAAGGDTTMIPTVAASRELVSIPALVDSSGQHAADRILPRDGSLATPTAESSGEEGPPQSGGRQPPEATPARELDALPQGADAPRSEAAGVALRDSTFLPVPVPPFASFLPADSLAAVAPVTASAGITVPAVPSGLDQTDRLLRSDLGTDGPGGWSWQETDATQAWPNLGDLVARPRRRVPPAQASDLILSGPLVTQADVDQYFAQSHDLTRVRGGVGRPTFATMLPGSARPAAGYPPWASTTRDP